MAVRGHYPSSAALMVWSTDVHFQQHCDLFASHNYQGALHPVLNGTVISEPESELTFNNMIFKTRKRNRDGGDDHRHDCSYASTTRLDPQRIHPNQFKSSNSQSEETSTSRSYFPYDINAQLLQQNHEIDSLLLIQNKKLRSGIEETRKRHYKSILSVIESHVLKWLEEKEHELANARQRNSELEERVKQMIAENQTWVNVVKNQEAIVSTLKSSLEQNIVQNKLQLEEGFGDSESVTEDAHSCSSASKTVEKMKKTNCCKLCQENEVSVLLLPCRHLCLCKSCEAKLDACPICNSSKNASIQILIT